MRTSILLLISLISLSTSAQFKKGEFMIGGTFSIADQKRDVANPGYQNETSSQSHTISPEITYFLTKNIGVHLFSSFNKSITKYESGAEAGYKYTTVGGGISTYKSLIGGLGVMVRLQASGGGGTETSFDPFYGNEIETKLDVFNFNVSPAVFYRFNRHFMLQSTFAQIAYDKVSAKYKTGGKETISQFSAGFLNSIQLSAYFIF